MLIPITIAATPTITLPIISVTILVRKMISLKFFRKQCQISFFSMRILFIFPQNFLSHLRKASRIQNTNIHILLSKFRLHLSETPQRNKQYSQIKLTFNLDSLNCLIDPSSHILSIHLQNSLLAFFRKTWGANSKRHSKLSIPAALIYHN